MRSTGEMPAVEPVSSRLHRTVTTFAPFQSTWMKDLAPSHSTVSVPLGLLSPSADAEGAAANATPDSAAAEATTSVVALRRMFVHLTARLLFRVHVMFPFSPGRDAR